MPFFENIALIYQAYRTKHTKIVTPSIDGDDNNFI